MPRLIAQVLFVSRENAVRSVLAQACLDHLGKGKFRAYSCGVPAFLATERNPWTEFALQATGIPCQDWGGKPWSQFTRNGAPRMDFVIALDAETLYDHPVWPGQPETALWSYPELPSAKGTSQDAGAAALATLVSLRRRIELLVSLHSKVNAPAELRHDLRDLAFV